MGYAGSQDIFTQRFGSAEDKHVDTRASEEPLHTIVSHLVQWVLPLITWQTLPETKQPLQVANSLRGCLAAVSKQSRSSSRHTQGMDTNKE